MTHTITPEALDLPLILASMRNFADVADRCEITHGNAPAAIRAWIGMLEALHAAPAAAGVLKPCNAGGIELTACQLREALLVAGDPEFDTDFEDRSRVRIFHYENGHSGPGLYCECVDAEEEGCILLDGKSPAIRDADAPASNAVPQEWILVPRNLTQAMRKAAEVVGPADGTVQYGISRKALYYVWEAFLSNAPAAQPQAEQQGAGDALPPLPPHDGVDANGAQCYYVATTMEEYARAALAARQSVGQDEKWGQAFRCGCFLGFSTKSAIPRSCPQHMRDRSGQAYPLTAPPAPAAVPVDALDALDALAETWIERADHHEERALEAESIGHLGTAVAIHTARSTELRQAAHALKCVADAINLQPAAAKDIA